MAGAVSPWQTELERLRSASGARVELLEPLPAGRSNVSLKINFEGQTAVFRINRELPAVDRAAEIRILARLTGHDWAPVVLFADPDLGLVTGWHESVCEAGSEQAGIAEVSRILEQLHAQRCTHPELALLHRIDQYVSAADGDWQSRHPISPLLESLTNQGIDLAEQTLLHMDLNPDNLIRTCSGVKLIDFEYAGGGHPLMDLASLCLNHRFGPEQQRRVLSCYDAPAHWRTALPEALALTAWLNAAWQQLMSSRKPQP